MDEIATGNQEQEKKFTLRTSDDIYDQFSLIAKERGHSVNTLINIAMREYIINKKGEVVLWKEFTSAMPISIEFNINY